MKPDGAQETTTQMARFLRAVYPIVDGGSLIELRAKWVSQCPTTGCSKKICREFFDSYDELEVRAHTLAPAADLYVGVATRRTAENGKKDNLAWGGAVFCEIDAGPGKPYPDADAILKMLDAFKPAPDLRVLSGSGVHCYWLLDWPAPLSIPEVLDDYEAVTRGLQERLKADKGTWDASRVLRLPDTYWHKSGLPRRVRLLT